MKNKLNDTKLKTLTSDDKKLYKYILLVPAEHKEFLIKVFGLNGKTDIFSVTPEERAEILELIKENKGNKFPI